MKNWATILVFVFLTATACAEEILHTQKSLYRNIAVVQDDNVRCLLFTLKRRESRQSCIDTGDPNRLVLPYMPMAFGGLLVNPNPRRVLVLGLGAGTVVEVFSQLFPDAHIDAVEIDPAVVAVAREYFGFSENRTTRVHVRDGRVFTRRARNDGDRYDYIMLDAFNGDYIPEHLMTREFLEECRELLTADGVLVANTFTASRLYDSESVTYTAAFGRFLNLRYQSGNRVIVTTAGDLPQLDELRENIGRVAADLGRFDIDLQRVLSLDRGRDWRRNARVLTDQYSPANLLRGTPD